VSRPALSILLALSCLLAGCSVLGADHTREDPAEDRLAAATAAMDAVETYSYETDIQVVASGEDRTERLTVALTGAVNHTERRVLSNATFQGERYRTYTLNRTVYSECGDPWGGWGVEELDEDGPWRNHTPAVRQLSLLESGSLYLNGTEMIDGRETTLLYGRPTSEALTRYSDRRTGSAFGGPDVEDATVRVWIDEETDRVRQVEVQFDVRGDGATASATLSSRFSAFDEPVSVSGHARFAQNARETGCPGQ